MQNVLRVSIRSASIQLLLELLESPADPVVAKRVLETIDWEAFFRCWKELSDLMSAQMAAWGMDPSEFLLTLPYRRFEPMHEFLDRVDTACPASAGFVDTTRPPVQPGAEEGLRRPRRCPTRLARRRRPRARARRRR